MAATKQGKKPKCSAPNKNCGHSCKPKAAICADQRKKLIANAKKGGLKGQAAKDYVQARIDRYKKLVSGKAGVDSKAATLPQPERGVKGAKLEISPAKLTGSEKQVAWAKKLRSDVIKDLDYQLNQIPKINDGTEVFAKEMSQVIVAAKEKALKTESAKVFIDGRNSDTLDVFGGEEHLKLKQKVERTLNASREKRAIENASKIKKLNEELLSAEKDYYDNEKKNNSEYQVLLNARNRGDFKNKPNMKDKEDRFNFLMSEKNSKIDNMNSIRAKINQLN